MRSSLSSRRRAPTENPRSKYLQRSSRGRVIAFETGREVTLHDSEVWSRLELWSPHDDGLWIAALGARRTRTTSAVEDPARGDPGRERCDPPGGAGGERVVDRLPRRQGRRDQGLQGVARGRAAVDRVRRSDGRLLP